MSATKPRSLFGNQLHQEISRHPEINSLRRLAYKVAPGRPESMRRQLHWWIKGSSKPTKASRGAVAAALGVHPSVFADPDDEEDVLTVLMSFLERKKKLVRLTGDPYAMAALK